MEIDFPACVFILPCALHSLLPALSEGRKEERFLSSDSINKSVGAHGLRGEKCPRASLSCLSGTKPGQWLKQGVGGKQGPQAE